MVKGGAVYILTNKAKTVLYTGVTSNLKKRLFEHRLKKALESFTAKYNCDKLVYYLFYPRIEEAIAAEKALKGSNRKAKQSLVNSLNPNWIDLYDELIKQ